MFALVTGATGFLGSHLVERLRLAGHQVRVLTRNPSKASLLISAGAEVLQGDVTIPESLVPAVKGIEVVFHSAALVTNWAPWPDFLSATVQGTENLLQASAGAGVKRFVHISTTRVYDDRYCRQHSEVTEDAPHGEWGFRPMGHYARAKVMAEAAVWSWQRRLAVSVIRPAWIYGPRDETILPPLIRFLRSPGARWPGRANPCADPIYATDVADCAITAALHARAIGQAYNATPPERINVREFLGAVCAALGFETPQRSVPYFLAALATHLAEGWACLTRRQTAPAINRAGLAILTEDVRYSSAKAERDLGWRTQVNLDDGIARTAVWLKERFLEQKIF